MRFIAGPSRRIHPWTRELESGEIVPLQSWTLAEPASILEHLKFFDEDALYENQLAYLGRLVPTGTPISRIKPITMLPKQVVRCTHWFIVNAANVYRFPVLSSSPRANRQHRCQPTVWETTNNNHGLYVEMGPTSIGACFKATSEQSMPKVRKINAHQGPMTSDCDRC